jgi:hypothetical protein
MVANVTYDRYLAEEALQARLEELFPGRKKFHLEVCFPVL